MSQEGTSYGGTYSRKGSEGQNESDLLILPDGELITVMRTGIHGTRDPHGRTFLDRPVLMTWSADQDSIWIDP